MGVVISMAKHSSTSFSRDNPVNALLFQMLLSLAHQVAESKVTTALAGVEGLHHWCFICVGNMKLITKTTNNKYI